VTAAIERLSLNQITIEQWSLAEAVDGCAAAGIGWIAPWRHKVAEVGAAEAARIISAAGLRVSSLCRGGFFPQRQDAENRAAVEEAAQLGTDVLVLVCGPPLDSDLRAARSAVAAGIERLLPHARDHGVRLAVEPLHPMLVSERSTVVTLGEALDLAERFDRDDVGVIVDAYHVFWDSALAEQLDRAAGRILGFHVSDWVTPRGDVLAARALMGDGIIDLRGLREQVDAAGYRGPIEVEVINDELRARPGQELLDEVVARFLAHV
jgi:sugar phosphate isomerase/epimerase